MFSPLVQESVFYVAITLITTVSSVVAYRLIEPLTYRVVLVFVTLIILSNCFAKLYALIIFKEDI